MLFLNQISCLCAIIVVCFSLIQASWLDYNIFANGRKIQERQTDPPVDGPTVTSTLLGTGVTTSPTPPSPPPPVTKTTATTPTSRPPTSTSAPTSASTSASNQKPSTSAADPIASTTTFQPSTTIELITSVVTVSGTVVTSVSSTEVITVPSEPTNFEPPAKDSSGISPKTRTTVVGVIAGLGGLLILGGLILLIRRLLEKRRNRNLNNGWSDFETGAPVSENMTGTGNSRPTNPFQSTLENYHNPARVNASSNF